MEGIRSGAAKGPAVDMSTSERPNTASRRPSTGRRPGTAKRPGTASVRIRKEAETKANPMPQVSIIAAKKNEIGEGLSAAKLKEVTGQEDLSLVTSIALKVDTRTTSLGRFGSLVPNLQRLVLSYSVLPTMRDLGTNLTNLTVLEVGSSGLTDLDGIGALQSLTELRAPNNEVTLCSPLVMCSSIKVLDLSSNRIADPEQLEYLGLCPDLVTLVLENNPVCTEQPDEETYKNLIRAATPNLRELDGVSLVGGAASTDNEAAKPRRPPGSGSSLRRPHTSAPLRAGRPGSASAARAIRSPGGTASSLTHGSTQLFQGSPLKALRARRASSGGDSVGGSMSDVAEIWRPGDENSDDDGDDDGASDSVFALEAEPEPSELDALLMSVGMAPVDSVADGEAAGLADQDVNSVLADLKAWRSGFASGASAAIRRGSINEEGAPPAQARTPRPRPPQRPKNPKPPDGPKGSRGARRPRTASGIRRHGPGAMQTPENPGETRSPRRPISGPSSETKS